MLKADHINRSQETLGAPRNNPLVRDDRNYRRSTGGGRKHLEMNRDWHTTRDGGVSNRGEW